MCHGQILTDAMRTARKVHKCDECGREIERGREYVYRAGIFDRRFDAYRMCVLCAAAEDDLRDEYGEACYSRGDVADHMRESIRFDGWRETLKALRAKVAELRERYGKKRGVTPITGEGGGK